MEKIFKYVYGPVESWRMGKSLGIDPLSADEKICNLDCCYCQLGKTRTLTDERRNYISTEEFINDFAGFIHYAESQQPLLIENLDYLTFCGRGEPTLAANLGEMIRAVKAVRPEEVAVITNSTLLYLAQVQRDLSLSDLVIAKLDAHDEISFQKIDQAKAGISFEKTLEGLVSFRNVYRGRFVLQIMFVEENKKHASRIADIARAVSPDEIQINTPLRPSGARPLNEDGLREVKLCFDGMPAVTAYERERKETIPLNKASTVRRHGNYKKACF